MKLLPIITLSAAIIGVCAGCVRTPPTITGTAAPKPIATTPAAKPTLLQKAKISKACSEQADAKNLHGKERKAFRVECMRSGGRSF
jgi:psiF repeat